MALILWFEKDTVELYYWGSLFLYRAKQQYKYYTKWKTPACSPVLFSQNFFALGFIIDSIAFNFVHAEIITIMIAKYSLRRWWQQFVKLKWNDASLKIRILILISNWSCWKVDIYIYIFKMTASDISAFLKQHALLQRNHLSTVVNIPREQWHHFVIPTF